MILLPGPPPNLSVTPRCALVPSPGHLQDIAVTQAVPGEREVAQNAALLRERHAGVGTTPSGTSWGAGVPPTAPHPLRDRSHLCQVPAEGPGEGPRSRPGNGAQLQPAEAAARQAAEEPLQPRRPQGVVGQSQCLQPRGPWEQTPARLEPQGTWRYRHGAAASYPRGRRRR